MQEMQATQGQSLGWENPLEEEMITHSVKSTDREKPGELQFLD